MATVYVNLHGDDITLIYYEIIVLYCGCDPYMD